MRFTALALCSAILGTSVVAEEAADFGIFAWIDNAEGGYAHPDQEFRYDEKSGMSGVFATKRIEKGETLLKVPYDLFITSDDPEEDSQLSCGTVRALAREMNKGNESFYAPYVNYLKTLPEGQIPSDFSDLGKKLAREIVGNTVVEPTIPPLEPTEWLTNDWYRTCGGQRNDKLSARAVMIIVQRSDDELMIPGYDMYNHRNGKYHNTLTKTEKEVNQITTASRTIEAGEQIFMSYNLCEECAGRKRGYGTPDMFRDYGFVEQFPQRWHYQSHTVQFELDRDENGEYDLTWSRVGRKVLMPSVDDYEPTIVWFRRQIRRLRRLYHIDYSNGVNPGMPELEWNLLWDFQQAHIRALTVAAEALEALLPTNSKEQPTCSADDQTCASPDTPSYDDQTAPHYDKLKFEMDDLDYVSPTCDNSQIMQFTEHHVVAQLQTHFQRLNFAIHPDSGDVMMDLDDIVQISSNYRPHYHEFSVHAAARYIENIQRVIFIGGGDSMLLHETLKYPNLELVVGLELDQIVTRQSFKYFNTQPHFDDPRVEWWFGDATKSLLLLPEDYWQTFDLVLVDLSETVMSLSVTEELDVFDALALLLKPEGVMVKNELYMPQFSTVFDYTMQIYYESPVICSQVMAFGSNTVDFMHHPSIDHGVETLLYEPLVRKDNRLDLLHDYSANDAREQGKCGDLPSLKKPEEQTKSAGVIEIVDAEEVAVELDASLIEKFSRILQEQGFNFVAEPLYDEGMLLYPMQEGYVMARMWPDKKYCALDINLWGSFSKLKLLSHSLAQALEGKVTSTYRIVVGGMYGSSTWSKDRTEIGPTMVQTRNCEEKTPAPSTASLDEVVEGAFDQSMKSAFSDSTIVALAICNKEEDCAATTLLNKYENVKKVVTVSTCPEMQEESLDTMYDCEVAKAAEIRDAAEGSPFNLVVVDGKTPFGMVQILNSILTVDNMRHKVLQLDNHVIAWSTNPREEPWRTNFLDRYRKQLERDPISRARYWMQAGEKAVEFGLLVSGNERVAYNFEEIEANLKTQFSPKNVEVELKTIHGGLFPFDDPFEPREFLQRDYDATPGIQQYEEQEGLGVHVVFQLEPADGKADLELTKADIISWLAQSMAFVEFACSSQFAFKGVGDGSMLTCLSPHMGTVILVWDGRQHIDINFFLNGEPEDNREKFMGAFLHYSQNSLKVALRDDMPRGIGRVINLPADLLEEDDEDQEEE